MTRPLVYTAAFLRAARRVTRRNAAVTAALSDALEADAFDPRLHTHKLTGQLADLWSASAGCDLRIVFQFVSAADVETILLLTCGSHDQVY